MASYRVREGYVVILGVGRSLPPGTIFEPSPEILANQSWKIERLPDSMAKAVQAQQQKNQEAIEAAMQEQEKQETKEVPGAPQDRLIKKPPVKK